MTVTVTRSRVSRGGGASVVDRHEGEVLIRSTPMPCPYVDEIVNYPEKVDTMSKLFAFACKKYGDRDCLGTREVLGES